MIRVIFGNSYRAGSRQIADRRGSGSTTIGPNSTQLAVAVQILATSRSRVMSIAIAEALILKNRISIAAIFSHFIIVFI